MSTSIDDTKLKLDNADFLAVMEKAREAADQSIRMMSALGKSFGGLSAPGVETFAGGINDAMKQGRQFSAQARQAFQGVGILDRDTGAKKPERKPAPLDHFKTPDADRLAKLGLFIGGAPQTPGLSEARRTATATEKISKGIDKLNVIFSPNNTKSGGVAAYSE